MAIYKTARVTQIDNVLIAHWKALWERSVNATIYNSYEWFLTWQELHKLEPYEIYVCYKQDILVALIPLVKSRCFGIPVVTTLLPKHLTDTPFLIETYDKEIITHFFALFLKKNIFFQKIASDAATLMQKTYPQFLFSLISVNPVITMLPDPFGQASHSTIKEIKKILRVNEGQLRFEIYKDNLDKHVETMFAINKKSSKQLRGKDIFSRSEYRNFYSTIVKLMPDLIRICFLYFKNTPIAYKYGYLYKNTFASDQIAYLSEYAYLSPGKLATYFLLKKLENTNVSYIDLGGGLSSHKTKFTKEYRLLYNLYYSPNPLFMLWWKGINIARRVKQIVLPKKNTQDSKFLFKILS